MPDVPKALVGAAGVHFVTAELSLRGLVAMPTIRNVAGADLLVWDPASGKQAVIQVKTSASKVKFWPTGMPDKCLRGPNAYYVFVRYDKEQGRFEAFIESADQVVDQINKNLDDQRQRGRKLFPYWHLPWEDDEKVEEYARAWRRWEP